MARALLQGVICTSGHPATKFVDGMPPCAASCQCPDVRGEQAAWQRCSSALICVLDDEQMGGMLQHGHDTVNGPPACALALQEC